MYAAACSLDRIEAFISDDNLEAAVMEVETLDEMDRYDWIVNTLGKTHPYVEAISWFDVWLCSEVGDDCEYTTPCCRCLCCGCCCILFASGMGCDCC